MPTKSCSKCGLNLPLDSFYTDLRIKKDGRYAHCKKCHSEMSNSWAKNHSGRVNELSGAWAKSNPDKVQAKLRRYRADPENRAKTNTWNKTYKKNNPSKIASVNAGRRARLLRATPPWLTPEMRKDIYFWYFIRSQMAEPSKWNVDHIWPLDNKVTNASGLHVPWNLRLIPKADNISKKNKIPTSPHPRRT